jgi:hypothetical protein
MVVRSLNLAFCCVLLPVDGLVLFQRHASSVLPFLLYHKSGNERLVFLLKVWMHSIGAVPPFEVMVLDMGDAKNTMTDSL